jgi:alkylhydroperoxidase family enzyme
VNGWAEITLLRHRRVVDDQHRIFAAAKRVADTAIPDGEFESASAAFSEKELADLTIAIGLMNAYNRLAIAFRNPPRAAT